MPTGPVSTRKAPGKMGKTAAASSVVAQGVPASREKRRTARTRNAAPWMRAATGVRRSRQNG